MRSSDKRDTKIHKYATDKINACVGGELLKLITSEGFIDTCQTLPEDKKAALEVTISKKLRDI